jgi:putative ATP-dependent endonuclease of OLD family
VTTKLWADPTAADEALKLLSETLATRHAEINIEHFQHQLVELSSALSDEVAAFASGRTVSVQSVNAEYKPQTSRFRVRIEDAGTETNVERQGHGFQRSLLIASLKLLAERGAAATDGSVICLAIEEPELFQHPSQARAFATVLRDLAESADSGIQVAYATHSPYFIEPRRYDQIRRVSRVNGAGTTFKVEVKHASVANVVTRLDGFVDADRVKKQVDGVCLNRLSEALFASAVVLVEGTGDKGVLDGVSERTTPLSVHSIAVAEVGSKTEFFIPFAVLEQLGIPTYIMFDSDSGLEARMTADGKSAHDISNTKTNTIAENRKILGLIGETEVDWPSGDIADKALALPDDLERLLDPGWPEWETARAGLVTAGLGFPGKDGDTYRLAAKTAGGTHPVLLEAVITRTRSSIGL